MEVCCPLLETKEAEALVFTLYDEECVVVCYEKVWNWLYYCVMARKGIPAFTLLPHMFLKLFQKLIKMLVFKTKGLCSLVMYWESLGLVKLMPLGTCNVNCSSVL